MKLLDPDRFELVEAYWPFGGWGASQNDGEPEPVFKTQAEAIAHANTLTIRDHQKAFPHDVSAEPCRVCGLPSNNGAYCTPHIDSLREATIRKRADWLATMQATYKYFIPDDTVFGEGDREYFTNYTVSGAQGNTIKEFLDGVTVSETDQDGGEVGDVCGFDEASGKLQLAILRYVGLTWEDVTY